MPVRFQVDSDFYDHPKTIGMSADAFKLWVRAGSFSAAKLTDGFIAEDVLVHTLGTDKSVADELVRRRLWRRVKSGYQFHAWGERNLTKQRVQDDQKADRNRKRAKRLVEQEAARNAAGQDEKPQPDPQNVRPESPRNPAGIQPESEGNPASSVSVSVSVSESVSGSGRDTEGGHPPSGEPPPPRCPKHLDNPTEDPCRPCGDARTAREAWEVEDERRQRHQAAVAKSRSAKERAELVAREIRACQRCDHLGRLPDQRVCTHRAEAAHAQELAAAARANIRPGPAGRQRADPIAEARRPDRSQTGLDDALAEVIPIRPSEAEPT